VNFSGAASGSPAPAYQWFFNNTNLLSGKTSGTLTLTNVQLSQAGGYFVTASNVAGVITSAIAQLTVLVPPTITNQPTNLTVISGSNAMFNVAASGTTPLAYQWQEANTNLPSAKTNVLLISNVQPSQAGNYRVIVTNVAGAVTSSVATLAVLTPPQIVTQPTNFTTIPGGSASFNVLASGSAPLSSPMLAMARNRGGKYGCSTCNADSKSFPFSSFALTRVAIGRTKGGPFSACCRNTRASDKPAARLWRSVWQRVIRLDSGKRLENNTDMLSARNLAARAIAANRLIPASRCTSRGCMYCNARSRIAEANQPAWEGLGS